MRDLSFVIMVVFVLLAGCAPLNYDPEEPLDRYYGQLNVPPPGTIKKFAICNHQACTGVAEVGFSTDQWDQIRQVFTTAAHDPDREREQIAAAIGLMEQMIGLQANTFADQSCNNLQEPLESFQLDCIAEATNSTTYLRLLELEGLLHWHRVSYPARRAVYALFVPHSTAVVRQVDGGELYAVDSWFRANGETAVIVPLPLWRQNYYPGPCSRSDQ